MNVWYERGKNINDKEIFHVRLVWKELVFMKLSEGEDDKGKKKKKFIENGKAHWIFKME